MPDQLTNVTITKVYEGKSGEGKFGPYTAYNFYVQGEDKKFGWFGGPKKITPVEGMEIAYMEYTTTVEGDFTNHKVSKLVLKEESTPEAIGNANEDLGPIPKATTDKSVSMYVAYIKDICTAIINSGGNLETADLDLIAERIGKAGLIMMNASMDNGQNIPSEAQTSPPEEDKPEPKGKAKTKPDKANGVPSKVICDNDDAPHKGIEVIPMYCRTQCKLKDTCATAKQLREME